MRTARLKPVHPKFIDMIETKIRPMLRANEMQDSFTQGTKVVNDIIAQIEIMGLDVSPLIKHKQNRIVLFVDRKKRRRI